MTIEQTADLVELNSHRLALGRDPLSACAPWEPELMRLCAEYGEDYWAPGVLEGVLADRAAVSDAWLLDLFERHVGGRVPGTECPPGAGRPLAKAWREACRRGIA